jgi:hypothetical protein
VAGDGIEGMDPLEAAKKLMEIASIYQTREGITPTDILVSTAVLRRVTKEARRMCRKRCTRYTARYAIRLAAYIERRMGGDAQAA